MLQPFSIETIPGLPPALAHICTPVGTCELEAGPHSFLETTVFEVRYGLQQASRPHELASRSNAGRNYAVPVPSSECEHELLEKDYTQRLYPFSERWSE